eukprot:10261988-Lingulodinium_polyedra.AAC.1
MEHLMPPPLKSSTALNAGMNRASAAASVNNLIHQAGSRNLRSTLASVSAFHGCLCPAEGLAELEDRARLVHPGFAEDRATDMEEALTSAR